MTYKLHLHPSVHLTFRGKYFPELSGVNLFKPKVQHIHSWCIWPNLTVLKTSSRMKGIRLCFYPENDKNPQKMTVTGRNRELQLPSFRESSTSLQGSALSEVQKLETRLTTQLVSQLVSQPVSRLGSEMILHSFVAVSSNKKLPYNSKSMSNSLTTDQKRIALWFEFYVLGPTYHFWCKEFRIFLLRVSASTVLQNHKIA